MSQIFVPDASQGTLLQMLLNYGSNFAAYIGNNTNLLTIHLFKSSNTPAQADVLATYTEADFPGYAAQSPGDTWGPAAIVNHKAVAAMSPDIVFRYTGTGSPQTIYGYHMVYESNFGNGNLLVWLEKFDAPVTLSLDGDTITITPKFQLRYDPTP